MKFLRFILIVMLLFPYSNINAEEADKRNSNGGSWSFSGYNSSSVPSGSNTTGTVRVVKNAGTYGGGGYYFVEVRGNQSS